MALVKCKECEKEISKKAETCPNCGYKQKNPSSILKLLGVAFLGVFALIFVILAINPNAGSSATVQKSTEQLAAEKKRDLDSSRASYARIIAEREIKTKLKAPAGAKLSGYSDTEVGPLSGGGPNEWIVKGYVDAQNSFGAILRNNYQVIIEFEEGKFDSSRVKKTEVLDAG